MTLKASTPVPTFTDPISLDIGAGESIVLIGANGAGKTRLGVFLDNNLTRSGTQVHRVAAHRSLSLNPKVTPPSFEIATKRLRLGNDNAREGQKNTFRFGSKPETVLLNDFDHLLGALYAENNDVSIRFRQSFIDGKANTDAPTLAKIDTLQAIWERVLPHRKLVVLGNNLKAKAAGADEYSASDMSDGERVIFYLIGQALLAQQHTLLIFDEPELHINKSILAKLWDEIEAARPDCAFLYITHDVEFARSRHAAKKYALRSYRKTPSEGWDIETIPDSESIPDDVVATIIGSRQPVLLVEGDGGSLDYSLYRRVYSTFTVLPVGSSEQVIHTVKSFAARKDLHRVGCVGLVDADGRTDEERAKLNTMGVFCLPVSEVENLLLLPDVFSALAEALSFSADETAQKMANLRSHVFTQANEQIESICIRQAKRQIDTAMKKIGLESKDAASLSAEFKSAVNGIDTMTAFDTAKSELTKAIEDKDYEAVLYHYDNKGLLAEVAKELGYQKKTLEEFIGRALRSDEDHHIHSALTKYLPAVTATQ